MTVFQVAKTTYNYDIYLIVNLIAEYISKYPHNKVKYKRRNICTNQEGIPRLAD